MGDSERGNVGREQCSGGERPRLPIPRPGTGDSTDGQYNTAERSVAGGVSDCEARDKSGGGDGCGGEVGHGEHSTS